MKHNTYANTLWYNVFNSLRNNVLVGVLNLQSVFMNYSNRKLCHLTWTSSWTKTLLGLEQ